MRAYLLIATISVFTLTACNSATKPSEANFTTAINQYLARHGQVCVTVADHFPIDVPASERSYSHGVEEKLAVLQSAGLLNETDTSAVVQNLAHSLSLSPGQPEPVLRYSVSAQGQKYIQIIMTDFGRAPAFCYGLKQVNSIIRWTAPATAGSSTEIQVTYTYRVTTLTSWASRRDVQQAFPSIAEILSGASTTDQMAALQSTTTGWVVMAV